MKRRKLLSLFLAACLVAGILPAFSTASYADALPGINDKSVYAVDYYVTGDCNLCANAYMLRRMALLLKSPGYKSITNTNMRGIASFDKGDGCNNDVRYSYSFTNPGDGITFSVKSIELTGSASEKTKKIKELLKTHPEGIVVWGPNAYQSGWPHAVLITGYNTKIKDFKCADSAYNKDGSNRGIMNFSDSLIGNISYCTRCYYLSATTLRKVNIKSIEKYSGKKIKIRWGDIYGQNRYQISKATTKSGKKIVKLVKSTKSNPVVLRAKKNKTFYYKVRGYSYLEYKDWTGKTHKKYVYGRWSEVKPYKLKKN